MFWIHGGGFATGSGGQALHSPDYLMPQKNVVVVTINYRLGAFGIVFLFFLENYSLNIFFYIRFSEMQRPKY